MLGSLTLSGRQNVPGIPGACTTRNFTYLARGPCQHISWDLSIQLWYHHLISKHLCEIIKCHIKCLTSYNHLSLKWEWMPILRKMVFIFWQCPVSFLLLPCNSMWPSDTIRPYRYGSTLAHVMNCCLTAPSHYLNQCWFIITDVLWHPPESNFTRIAFEINLQHTFGDDTFEIASTSHLANELTHWSLGDFNSI